MDRKEAVTILQEKRDLTRKLEAAEKSADWAVKDRVDSSSLRASQHGRYADALDMAISALSPPNEPPPCYQPDGDGCAYQCYDGDDEPIDKCKECPLCYSDKQRHHTPPNEPRMINADKLAKRIAGHSNYHGDSILAAIYCAAEGKESDIPIQPIETQPNEPLTCEGCYYDKIKAYVHCSSCSRDKKDLYRRPPEGEVNT